VSEHLDRLVAFYESLTPASVSRVRELYAADAWFKDPFNEVEGAAAIEGIFRHMFEQVEAPRFVVGERIEAGNGVMLTWEFRFRGRGTERCVRGASHLRFDAAGRVAYHRDYWDAAEELYAKLPLIGLLMRALQRALRAPAV
jgi:ketosteroid isomerase-like protein